MATDLDRIAPLMGCMAAWLEAGEDPFASFLQRPGLSATSWSHCFFCIYLSHHLPWQSAPDWIHEPHNPPGSSSHCVGVRYMNGIVSSGGTIYTATIREAGPSLSLRSVTNTADDKIANNMVEM